MIPNFDHISEPNKYIMARKMILSYVHQVIKDKKLNQNDIAEQMRIKPASLSRMLKGDFPVTLDMLLKMCDVVGCYPFIIDKDSDDDLVKAMKERWLSQNSAN